MRSSIANKVTFACAALLVLSIAVALLGLRVANEMQVANTQIGNLVQLLREQDGEDSAQRRVRLAVGDATRKAERNEAVSAEKWSQLEAELLAFRALSAAPVANDAIVPIDVREGLVQTRSAAKEFVPSGLRLVELAQRDPAAIKREMPAFLGALRNLENERTHVREALGVAIEDAVKANVIFSKRNAGRLLVGAIAAILILCFTAIWLRIRVIAPIATIAERVRSLGSGEPDDRAVPGQARPDELGDLARGLQEYRHAVDESRDAQRKIDFLAHHDPLTGLPNRFSFESRLVHELARSARSGSPIAVFAIDMDGFKEINDRYGHAGGDDALRRTAKLLSSCIRADDLVARIGGDEFAIVQAAGVQPAGAEALLSRLNVLSADKRDDVVPVRMSIGVAISNAGQGADDLYNAADLALYRAKADGRNTARFYDADIQEEVTRRRQLGRDLERAIEADELYVVFQPIATTKMTVVGYEALLRWRHPTLGDVPPSEFIAIAEGTGQIESLGMWMAERSIAIAAGWNPEITLSINLSPLQFRNQALGQSLLGLAEKYGVKPSQLEFEVTESATLLGNHRQSVLATLRLLQDSGAAVTMDDFGTGHSSLSNLKDFRFDRLKIDRSFIAAMLTDEPSASIIRATIGLGRSLGASIVAEGVEREDQFDQLKEWGCNAIQGYLIGRPAEMTTPLH